MCEILSRSNLAVRRYGPDKYFRYMCTVTLTLERWPWVKVMTHPWVMDNNSVKYYPDPTWSEELWPGHGIWVCVHCDLDIRDTTMGQGHDTFLGHGQKVCEILSRSNLSVRRYGPDKYFRYMHTVTLTLEIWPWVKVMTHPWVMDNNNVKYYPDPTWSGELWPGQGIWVCVPCDLDIRDMTLGHGQKVCEILSRSNLSVRRYGPDKYFRYMCTVTLTLEIWPWVKAMTHLWVMDNICDEWNIIQTLQVSTKLWPRHDVNRRTDGWTDGQGDSYIPPSNFVWGVKVFKRRSNFKVKATSYDTMWKVLSQGIHMCSMKTLAKWFESYGQG